MAAPTPNPFLYERDGSVLLELVQSLVLYLRDAPGPVSARKVYDHYMQRFGDHIRRYCSTAAGSIPLPWNAVARHRFETVELPELRRRENWGYGFDDGQPRDTQLFMFHGSRPHTEAGRASFYRFEFAWNTDPAVIHQLACDLIDFVPCLSGTGGYSFRYSTENLKESFDQMYAWARRYWGIEAQHLDRTVKYVLSGIKTVNWLTIVGRELMEREPAALDEAKRRAFSFQETPLGIVFQAEEKQRFGDVNRQEDLPEFKAIASALLPLQIQEHQSFGGTRWTDDNTYAYLRRFTDQTP